MLDKKRDKFDPSKGHEARDACTMGGRLMLGGMRMQASWRAGL